MNKFNLRDRKRVLAVWPWAESCRYLKDDLDVYYIKQGPATVLGRGCTESAAWKDAAKRLPKGE